MLTRLWFPGRPGESKRLGILVLQHAEVGSVCPVMRRRRTEVSPVGRRAGKGQPVRSDLAQRPVREDRTHTVTRTAGRHSVLSARCPAQPHVVKSVSNTQCTHKHSDTRVTTHSVAQCLLQTCPPPPRPLTLCALCTR